MKQFITILFFVVSAPIAFSQTSREPSCNCYPCCPSVIEVTITGTDLDSLSVDSLLAITPSAGKAIRLVKPPVIRAYRDGLPIIFASGEYIQILNEFGPYGDGIMSMFDDRFVTPYEGVSTGSFFHSYYMPFNGQSTPSIPHTCTGSVYIWSTFPISGGGPNAKIVITIWYEEIAYP